MIIDFKEIPVANKGGGEQDRFEQFACDFLEVIGFKILRRPDRGPDGKKDLIVSEIRPGVVGETTIKWLVSCKHFAHSGKSVYDSDDSNILDRVKTHGCDGFMGIYSTLPAVNLATTLHNLKLNREIDTAFFDNTSIEKEVLNNKQRDRLLISYFPNSHDKFHHKNVLSPQKTVQASKQLTEDDVLQITKTAIILLEIDKIKEEYHESEYSESSLNKLYRYTDHSNEKIAAAIFIFLQSIAYRTRDKRMPSSIPSALHFLILNFFPSSFEKEEKTRIENGLRCIDIGSTITYDAFIYRNKFKIAEDGLSILKFIYREGNRNNWPELTEKVLEQYAFLGSTLNRPERNDLENAKQLLKVYKDDLNTGDLGVPPLPKHLSEIVRKEELSVRS